jgi:choline dehydrogenase
MEKVQAILQDPRVQKAMHSSVLRTSAAVGALLLVLRFYLARKSKTPKSHPHITNFEEIAQKTGVKDGGHAANEYDVIIVGGGTSERRALLRNARRSDRHVQGQLGV